MPSAQARGPNNVQQPKENHYQWWWTSRPADPEGITGQPEEGKAVHKCRCCNFLFVIPSFHQVDGFSALAASVVTLVFLLIAFFAIFPHFEGVQTELVRGASEFLAKSPDDQWAPCPDVWRSYHNVSGEVQFSSSTFPNISCKPPGTSEEVSMALPPGALVLLGFMSFFNKDSGSGQRLPYWCYTQEEMIDLFSNKTANSPSIRAAVTEPEGGCLSTSRNHTCITNAVNMIPKWNQTCIGLERWGYARPAAGNASIVLDWIEDWTLKDVLSFSYSRPGYFDPYVALVVRLYNSRDRQRYDYVVPLAGVEYHSDAALTKFNRMLQALHSASNRSEWAYVYDAFKQTFQGKGEGARMRNCLKGPGSDVQVVDSSTAAKPEFHCPFYVDKSMWGAWQTAYSVYQQGLFKLDFPIIHVSMNYDVFFATWAGLMGAFLSAIFAAIGFVLYFLAAVCYQGRDLSRKHRDVELKDAISRFLLEQHTRNKSAKLLQAEMGFADSPLGSFKACQGKSLPSTTVAG